MSVIFFSLRLDFKVIVTLMLNNYCNMHNVFKLCTVIFYGFAPGHKFDIDNL